MVLLGQCYLSVAVENTDFDEDDEYVAETTVNGAQVHGRCSPSDGASPSLDDGFFRCTELALIPPSTDNTYVIATTLSAEVDENFDGNYTRVTQPRAG